MPHQRPVKGNEGQHRSASDFDYFRGCPFSTAVPAIYADGDIGDEPAKKKKGSSDVADTETLTRERWTAAKLVPNQLRIVIGNAYEPAHETAIEPGCNPTISHDQFMRMIRPLFGSRSRALTPYTSVCAASANEVPYQKCMLLDRKLQITPLFRRIRQDSWKGYLQHKNHDETQEAAALSEIVHIYRQSLFGLLRNRKCGAAKGGLKASDGLEVRLYRNTLCCRPLIKKPR